MENDLIREVRMKDVQEAIDNVDWWSDHNGKLAEGARNSREAYLRYDDVVKAIEAIPAVDAVEVRHGRWTSDFCSVCGVSKYNWFKVVSEESGPFGEWKFCPGCGARMDGRREDGDGA